jgi:hypothetical protein
MSDNKPNVFPNKEQREQSDDRAKQAAFEAEKAMATNEIYTNSMIPSDTPDGHKNAVEMMRRRTEEQLMLKKQAGVVKDSSLSETPQRPTISYSEMDEIRRRSEEQIRLRDENLAKNASMIQSYQRQVDEASTKKDNTQNINQNIQNNMYQQQPQQQYSSPVQQTVTKQQPQDYGQVPSNVNPHIYELSQPDFNSAFDVIPLPSQGKSYRSKKPNIRVSYMTTADENILSSPNLLQSGQFLEILMNRKILEPELRYRDLLVGDRNAIMIWLRATSYGYMYPVTLLDENDNPFDTEVSLSDLKIKNFGAEPDSEGLFDFTFPISKHKIKFRFLTCGDIEDIEKMLEADKLNDVPVNKASTYAMQRMVVEVNGNRDRNSINDYVESIRLLDGKKFNEYVESIESGIDLSLKVGTPGGGSVDTFLPINLSFFWPNLRV